MLMAETSYDWNAIALTLSGFEPITDTGDHASITASINCNASGKRQQLVASITGSYASL